MLDENQSVCSVYFIYSPENNMVKIGTSDNIKRRFSTIQSMSPVQLFLIGSIEGSYDKENELHRRFNENRMNGEWFLVDEEINDFLCSLFGDGWSSFSLFPDDVMDSIVSYKRKDGQSVSIKYRDCKFQHHEFNREQQIRNLRRQNKSFEVSEMRREVIMPIMKSDPDMTTEQAVDRLSDKQKIRKAA